MTQEPRPSHLRASDLDRERVADELRDAAGDGRLDFNELDERLAATYAAKTYGELEPITADLPSSRRGLSATAGAIPGTVPATRPAAGMPVGSGIASAPAIAIFGGAVRKGTWFVPRRLQALAIFGGVELDLRDATLEDREVTIVANAFFGGVEITVPEGVAVRTSGSGIMGGYDGPNDDGGAPDGPVIHVTGVAIFGGVEVKRRPPVGTKAPRSRWLGGKPPSALPRS